jgi:hypothetical protein
MLLSYFSEFLGFTRVDRRATKPKYKRLIELGASVTGRHDLKGNQTPAGDFLKGGRILQTWVGCPP